MTLFYSKFCYIKSSSIQVAFHLLIPVVVSWIFLLKFFVMYGLCIVVYQFQLFNTFRKWMMVPDKITIFFIQISFLVCRGKAKVQNRFAYIFFINDVPTSNTYKTL